RSTTTGRVFRRRCARMCSSPSCGSTMRATRTKAAPDLGLPSPATSRAPTAATLRLATRRSGACARPVGFLSREASPLLALHIRRGARQDFYQMGFGIGIAFKAFADGRAQVLERRLGQGREGAPFTALTPHALTPAVDAFAQCAQPIKHRVDDLAIG